MTDEPIAAFDIDFKYTADGEVLCPDCAAAEGNDHMTPMTCATCRWRETEGEAHACVRYPPTVTILALPEQDRLSGEMRMGMQRLTAYPALELANRCGEWKSRLPETHRLNLPGDDQ